MSEFKNVTSRQIIVAHILNNVWVIVAIKLSSTRYTLSTIS